jgi:hypothetical protein
MAVSQFQTQIPPNISRALKLTGRLSTKRTISATRSQGKKAKIKIGFNNQNEIPPVRKPQMKSYSNATQCSQQRVSHNKGIDKRKTYPQSAAYSKSNTKLRSGEAPLLSIR